MPLIAGSASFTLFSLIKSIFLGPLGEVPLAAVSLTTLTFATVCLGHGQAKPWAASEAAALRESNGDEFPLSSQSVSPTPNQPHSRRKS